VFSQSFEYPEIINNGSFLLNSGIGFGKGLDSSLKVPPLFISGDSAIPIAGLPFTAGLALAWSAEEGKIEKESRSSKNLGLAFRLGLHEGWGINRLDTYILLTLGGVTSWESARSDDPAISNKTDEINRLFWFGLGAGARWFFLPKFGINTELTIGNFYNFAIGFSLLI
jgi:hypothetical protein